MLFFFASGAIIKYLGYIFLNKSRTCSIVYYDWLLLDTVFHVGHSSAYINSYFLDYCYCYYSFSKNKYFYLLIAPIEGFIALIG